jgi:hypothetical protein
MKTISDGTRYLEPKTIKASFRSLEHFKIYWQKHDYDFVKRYSFITEEEAQSNFKEMMQKISSEFQDGDEIIHFDDYGIAMKRCEREYVLIRRKGKVIKSELIRMS